MVDTTRSAGSPDSAAASDYRRFLDSKHLRAEQHGFDADEFWFPPALFDWQKVIVRRACKVGRYAIFAECGLGKTLMQLAWATQILRRFGGRVLILTPPAVARQTVAEAAKFEIAAPVRIVREQKDVADGINITNYERLHLFDAKSFMAVVCDESGILKAYTGKTKQQLCTTFAATPYRLCCTATPSPNDLMELGNQAAFLGVMDSDEMLARWFINDTMTAGNYRLMKHAEEDYWRWVSEWAAAVSTPADLGFDSTGYDLPPLTIHEHEVASPHEGRTLFDTEGVSATGIQKEYRRSLHQRVEKAVELVAADPQPWLVWCHTDAESDALTKSIPGAVDVKGSHPLDLKEERIAAFIEGRTKILVSKPVLLGLGLNLQHCRRQLFSSPSFSFEAYYQAVRRCWRFGQTQPVDVHFITTPALQAARQRVLVKEEMHKTMRTSLAAALRKHQGGGASDNNLTQYRPNRITEIPQWMQSKPSPSNSLSPSLSLPPAPNRSTSPASWGNPSAKTGFSTTETAATF